jgi:hypothetical protein
MLAIFFVFDSVRIENPLLQFQQSGFDLCMPGFQFHQCGFDLCTSVATVETPRGSFALVAASPGPWTDWPDGAMPPYRLGFSRQ